MEINEDVLNMVKAQFTDVMGDDYDYYANYKIYLSNEQQFSKKRQREDGAIYIVIRFLPATITFGQTVLPATITAISERNNIETCQKLLMEFALRYNLSTNKAETITQIYETPSVSSNFNEIFDGFRSVFYMNCTFLISENSNPFEIYISDTQEHFEGVTQTLSCDIQLDTQATFNSKDFTNSKARYGTFAFNITTYLTDKDVINKCLAIMLKDKEHAPDGVNTEFNFDIVFKNGYSSKNGIYYAANITVNRSIGSMPTISISFTN